MEKKAAKTIAIRAIPVGLWRKVRAKAVLEGKSTRQAVIDLFEKYLAEGKGKGNKD